MSITSLHWLGPARVLVSTRFNRFVSSMPSCNCSSKSPFMRVATEPSLHQRTVRVASVASISIRCVLISSRIDTVGGDARIRPFRASIALIWIATFCSSSTKDFNVEVLVRWCRIWPSRDSTFSTWQVGSSIGGDELGMVRCSSSSGWSSMLFALSWNKIY